MCIIIRKKNWINLTGSETWWTRNLTCQAESSLMRRHFWLRSHVSHRPMRQWLSRYILFYKQNISVLLAWPFSLPNSSNTSNFSPSLTNVTMSKLRRHASPRSGRGFPICCHVTLSLSRDHMIISRDFFCWVFELRLNFAFCQYL